MNKTKFKPISSILFCVPLTLFLFFFCFFWRYSSKTAQSILDTILSIQPKDSSSGGGETRESLVYRLCDDMLDSLPLDYSPFEVRQRLAKIGALEPMNIFLKQEIDRMQRVIATVRATLTDLKLAIDGTIIMSENLRDALDSMFDARIPSYWQKVRNKKSTQPALVQTYRKLWRIEVDFHAWKKSQQN